MAEESSSITREMLEDAVRKIRESDRQNMVDQAHRGSRFWGSLPDGFVEWVVREASTEDAQFVSSYGELVSMGVPVHPQDAREAREHMEDLVRRYEQR